MNNDIFCSAITDRKLLVFTYSEEERTVEPHLLGINKRGVLILSAWQTSGKYGWRGFYVEKIKNTKIVDETFLEARPDYNPNDSTMSQIICHI